VSFFLQGVWENPYRHQKVLVSNFGLTVFVKHQVNWLNRLLSLPSGKEKKKQLKGKNLRSLFFAPYWSKSLQMLLLSLFIKSIHASQNI
jgi:hypothetical protein